MAEKKAYVPTYADELALSHHFVRVLEHKLAGRDSTRRINTHPLDWCHLGVIGPMKLPQAGPVQLDAEALEAETAENGADAKGPGGTAQPKAKPGVAPGKALAAGAGVATADAGVKDDDNAGSTGRPDRGDDREGARRPPSAIGFEMLVQPDPDGTVELNLDVQFCIFTKHLPTFAEQTGVLDDGASVGAPLAEVVQRWPLAVQDIKVRLPASGGIFTDHGAVQAVLDQQIDQTLAREDTERHFPGTRPKLEKADLDSAGAFDAFLASRVRVLPPQDRPALCGALEVRATPRPDGKVRIGCYFKNETLETPPLTRGKGMLDAFKVLSDVRLQATLNQGELHPIEILPVPQDYQYDRRVWAVGHNTSVVVDREADTVRSAALAVFEQPRIMTRDVVPTRFADLAKVPFQTLDAIYAAMCSYRDDWHTRVLESNALNLDPAALAECQHDYTGFVDEIRRFACGVAALKADPRLLSAFQASNRVFARLAKGYDSWRLFQVVYIVTLLPSLAIRENLTKGQYPDGEAREWANALDWGDVLWFRTGGGKTEAYLGLSCCAMLYDRLRNKRFGMTAWLRFPLRMLSIQQLQRAMRVVWEAEVERKRLLGDEATNSAPFRLGYFVGSTTTPNRISAQYLSNFNEEDLERVRAVPDCPACEGQGSVRAEVDVAGVRLRHVCQTCKAELPLDVTDDEVYRNLPTLVVGTIDKMASVGLQPKFGLLWGGVKWKCPQHGYGFGDHCTVWGCTVDRKQRRTVKPYDAAPSLHIQDELHLLQEELGAFAGHYETLIRHCERTVGGLPSKVIAATATIEGFENQVRHLYGVKDARRFPGRGYDRMNNFYAEPDRDTEGQPKTARIFVAFKSPSLSPADASAFCTQILQTEIGLLFSRPQDVLAFVQDAREPEDVPVLLRHYSTTLNYVSSLAKGSRVRQTLEEVAAKVRPGQRELNGEYLSSRSSSAEVAHTVHRVETPPEWTDPSFLDVIVATNMISHGVDLERVNLMTMDGVPEATAEYIQASSRSGRRHVGLVVVVLSNYSLRANSIYHRFIEYHQHLDRMVTPVPVNRFAKYAAQRTLPGVFLGLVYGVHAALRNSSKLNLRAEVAALLADPNANFLAEVKQAYCLHDGVYDERLEKALGEVLAHQLDIVRMSITNRNDQYASAAVRPKPMMSLRDVEAGVPFFPEPMDGRLLTFVHKSKD